jgi:hypothetical protein
VPNNELPDIVGELEGLTARFPEVALSVFDDVKFLTYEPGDYGAVREVLSRIIDARRKHHRSTWRPSPQAHDIYKRMFFAKK